MLIWLFSEITVLNDSSRSAQCRHVRLLSRKLVRVDVAMWPDVCTSKSAEKPGKGLECIVARAASPELTQEQHWGRSAGRAVDSDGWSGFRGDGDMLLLGHLRLMYAVARLAGHLEFEGGPCHYIPFSMQ